VLDIDERSLSRRAGIIAAVTDRTKAVALIALVLESILALAIVSLPEDLRIYPWASLAAILSLTILGLMVLEYRSIRPAREVEPNATIAVSPTDNTHPLVTSFRAAIESDALLKVGANTVIIETARAYRLVTFAFERETFDRFFALDLTFCRWDEILDDDQAVNVSADLLAAIDELLRKQRCKTFQRIFVATEDQLFSDSGQRTLQAMRARETAINESCNGTNCKIETRIFPYPTNTNPQKIEKSKRRKYQASLQKIHESHDFAVFGGSQPLAIIESGLSSPLINRNIRMATCELTTDRERISGFQKLFDELWEESMAVTDYLRPVAEQRGSHGD
jgi:hypothetical protein